MSLTAMLFAATLLFQGLDETGTAIARPIGDAALEPTTGSYFQVFEFFGRPPYTWRHAKLMVKGYLHEGREGRLATIKSQSVHYFLLVKFPMVREQKMWIGLSATCNEHADIEWLDGSSLSEAPFRAWNDGAQRKISRTCRAKAETGTVLPVYYDPHELGTRWEPGTATTNLRYMMVEFPVPAEESSEEPATEGPEQPLDPAKKH